MEYTEQQIKAAVAIFGDAVIKNLTTGTVPLYKNADDIDIEFEVEELLKKHCLVCGNMDDISKYVADRIQCTVSAHPAPPWHCPDLRKCPYPESVRASPCAGP